jgi:ribose transport system ATP-binding protein
MTEILLQLKNITKIYPGVTALNDITLDVRNGEVHALVGENGAGKSTLIKTCSGAIRPDSGKIIINGETFTHMTPKLSKEKGIAVIYQEFNLVNELTVAENVFLGRAIRNGIIVDKKAMAQKAAEIFTQFDINIDPNAMVSGLTVGYRQIVEIVKALSTSAKLIVMDEPSAPLTNAEVEHLYAIVKKLKATGVTIIYISHRLDEVLHLSDRITVMRDGEKIETVNTADIDIPRLIASMVGRELKETFPPRENCVCDEVVLEVQGLTGNGVRDISFNVKKGEILGFAGLIGAGRTELAELIFQVKPRQDGTIRIRGREINYKNVASAIGGGVSLVPEDRKRHGVFLETSIRENIVITILRRISSLSVVHKKEERQIVQKYRDELRIKTPGIEQQVKNLSGGNQQKVVVAKWLATEPELIILDEPTRGIDVGAKYEIYKLINDLVAAGKTIILISSEMGELIGMADRIIVLADGRVTGELERPEFNQERIMAMASKTEKEALPV